MPNGKKIRRWPPGLTAVGVPPPDMEDVLEPAPITLRSAINHVAMQGEKPIGLILDQIGGPLHPTPAIGWAHSASRGLTAPAQHVVRDDVFVPGLQEREAPIHVLENRQAVEGRGQGAGHTLPIETPRPRELPIFLEQRARVRESPRAKPDSGIAVEQIWHVPCENVA